MENFPSISDHLHIKQGFCHPDWSGISQIIEENLPESEWNTAWEAVSRIWMESNKTQLGGNYEIYETPNFMILSDAPMRIMKDACKSYEESLKQIIASFDGVASDEGYGKYIVMMFASLDEYYSYISYFYPDGESPMSSGVRLSGEGYAHFAFPTVDYSSYRSVLVHELTHGCLEHLPIPTWLNEALAMRMEESLCGSDIFHLDQEIYDKHAAHWNEDTIQQFWSGKSWGISGNSFELSYNLAQVLWRKIEADLGAPRPAILQFILDAHCEDAGESACQDIFELGLDELITDFLGEGMWIPDPLKWYSEKG